jgi:hypothetical protein
LEQRSYLTVAKHYALHNLLKLILAINESRE